MEWETDGAPVDQDRLRKAREQAKAFVAGGRAEPHVKGPRLFSDQEAKQILDRTIRMAADGKINDDNAFSLDGIDALVHLVLAAKRCGTAEGHFQQSGMGLSGGVALYGKRVDALYKVMYKQLSGKEPVDEDEEAGAWFGPLRGSVTRGRYRAFLVAACCQTLHCTCNCWVVILSLHMGCSGCGGR